MTAGARALGWSSLRTAALAACALLAALSAHSQAVDDRPESREVDVNRGRFVALGTMRQEQKWNCTRCHGYEGAANSSGAFPRLADQSAWYLYKSLHDYATGLRPNEVMQAVARELTLEEMRDVAAFYAAIEDAPYPAEPRIDREVYEVGETIARFGIPSQGVPACNECHGIAGIGDAPVYPYLAGQFAPYLQYQLLLWKAGRRDGDPMNVMELIAGAMTDEQIAIVSRYYAALRPPEVTPEEGADLAALNAWKLPGEPPLRLAGVLPAAEHAGPVRGDVGAAGRIVPRRDTIVVPRAEPPPGPTEVELPTGLPRRPFEEELPPAYSPPTAGEGMEKTVTTTGEDTEAREPQSREQR